MLPILLVVSELGAFVSLSRELTLVAEDLSAETKEK